MNTDVKSGLSKTPEKCLQEAGREKKKMYSEECLQKHRHFSPFVSSVNRLLGVEAKAILKRIASHLATKWRQTYCRTCGYAKSKVAITSVQATH